MFPLPSGVRSNMRHLGILQHVTTRLFLHLAEMRLLASGFVHYQKVWLRWVWGCAALGLDGGGNSAFVFLLLLSG